MKVKLISDARLNLIRGKASVGHATTREIQEVFAHLDALESELDKRDLEDFFGTEGWRHAFGHPDAD